MPTTVMKSIAAAALLAGSPAPAALLAQSGSAAPSSSQSQDESRRTLAGFTTGVAVGTMRFASGRSETAVSAALQYSPSRWVFISATPGYGHTSLARFSGNGFTDLPLTVGAFHPIANAPWSPSVSGAVFTALSFADSGSLGAGRTTTGASGSLSAWATEDLNLAIGATRLFTADAGNGSVDLEAAYSLGTVTPNAGYTSEVGHADSGAALARSIAAGLAIAVAGPLTLTVDGSHGLTTGAPSWTFSVGFGTAFAGISPLSPSSSLRRLSKVLGSRVSATSGYAKGGSGSKNCKTTGTC